VQLPRSLATASAPKTDGPSLKETIERLKHDPTKKEEGEAADASSSDKTADSSSSSTSAGTSFDLQSVMSRAADAWDALKGEVQTGWNEIVASSERKSINKKLIPTETAGGDVPYTGPVNIMIIDPSENLTAWERMQKRLTEAPIIQSIFEKSDELYRKSGADKVKRKMDDLREDAQEAWETSQNPWVYRISSVYETVTAESPETLAVAELRKLDPDFTLEDWRRDVVQYNLPKIMEWFLEGRINQLKPWLGEGVFKRMAAEMKAREQEGTQIDTHVLGIMNSEILAVEVSTTVTRKKKLQTFMRAFEKWWSQTYCSPQLLFDVYSEKN
jgi:mitochondrial import inner membrane translocase subunit TIM44